jgi:polysaccharide biosynthesis transport protein
LNPQKPGTSVGAAPQFAMLPEQFVGAEPSAAQIRSVLAAYRWKIVCLTLALLVASAVIVKLWPKSYAATVTMMVNQSNQGGPDYVNALASYMSTQVALMRSPRMFATVVERLNLIQDPEFTAGYRPAVSTLDNWVQQSLADKLDIAQVGNSQLLSVTATSKSFLKAAQLANAVADAYLAQTQYHEIDQNSDQAHQYSAELKDLRTRVTAAQDRVTTFRQSTGITDINNNRMQNDVEVQMLTDLEQRLLEAQNQRHIAESQRGGDQATRSNVLGSTLIQNLKSQDAALQSQLAQLRATLGSDHPKVMEITAEIAATRKSLAEAINTYATNSSAELASAQEVEAKLQAAVVAQRERVQLLRSRQDEGTKLQLELEAAQTVYRRALEDITFASTVSLTNINIVSRATPSAKFSKPNKMVMMLCGAILSLLVGVLGPVGFEFLIDRRLRCRDDFERDLGIPVLAEFDHVAAIASVA